MKIAVSAEGPLLSSNVDGRFGRAPWFIVCDTESGEFEAVKNEQNMSAAQGAGIQSAQLVANKGAQTVITGHCGPKAFRVLTSAGIGIYVGANGTVSEILDKFKAGSLKEAVEADVESHWA